MTDDTFESADLRAVHGKFVTGVTVVTTTEGDVPRGLTLNAFSSLTLEPPLVMVSVQTRSGTHGPLFASRRFAINILSASQEEVARVFAGKSPDKFENVEWAPGTHGSPVLAGTTAWLEVATTERVRVGTHTLFVGQVLALGHTTLPPLVYAGGQFFDGACLTREN